MSEKILVIDIGNTNIHAGVYNDSAVENVCRFLHCDADSHNRFFAWIIDRITAENITGVAVCSVASDITSELKSVCGSLPLLKIHSELDVRFDLRYTPRSSFGADRLANLVGFRNRYNGAGIIIDIGSALTCDLLDAQGRFAGGLIFPGPGLCLNALNERTSKLPVVSLTTPHPEWGFSTESSIQSGVFKGFTGIIESLIKTAHNDLNDHSATVVLTGGWSELWKDHIAHPVHFDPWLTLKGIGDIFCISGHNAL